MNWIFEFPPLGKSSLFIIMFEFKFTIEFCECCVHGITTPVSCSQAECMVYEWASELHMSVLTGVYYLYVS